METFRLIYANPHGVCGAKKTSQLHTCKAGCRTLKYNWARERTTTKCWEVHGQSNWMQIRTLVSNNSSLLKPEPTCWILTGQPGLGTPCRRTLYKQESMVMSLKRFPPPISTFIQKTFNSLWNNPGTTVSLKFAGPEPAMESELPSITSDCSVITNAPALDHSSTEI